MPGAPKESAERQAPDTHSSQVPEKRREAQNSPAPVTAGENINPVIIRPTVFRVPNIEEDANLVAVMMPFSSEFESVYETIKESCAEVNLGCRRADDMWTNEKVIDDIVELIFSAHFVVVDFSKRNPNVMYETGISHMLGKNVIPIVQDSSDVPFDLQAVRYIHYLNNNEGREELKSKLTFRLANLVGIKPAK